MQCGGRGTNYHLALIGSLLAAALYVVDGQGASQLAHNVVSMSQGPHSPNTGGNNPQGTGGHRSQNTEETVINMKPVEPQFQQAENNYVKTSHTMGALKQGSNSLKNSGSTPNRKGSSSGCDGAGPVGSIFCPQSQMQCSDGQTCCWMYTQCWGCCPYPNAVCCADEVHCCPAGYTCGAEYCSCGDEVRLPFEDLRGACRKPSNNLLSYLKTSYLRKYERRP